MTVNDDSQRRPRDIRSGADTFADYRRVATEREAAAASRPLVPAAIATVCALLVAVGSFGPWLHQRLGRGRPLETTGGLALDGWLSLTGAAVALVALLVLLLRPTAAPAAWTAVAGLALGVVVGAANWLLLDTTAPAFVRETPGASHEVGWGLLLVVAAGLLGVAASIVLVRRLD